MQILFLLILQMLPSLYLRNRVGNNGETKWHISSVSWSAWYFGWLAEVIFFPPSSLSYRFFLEDKDVVVFLYNSAHIYWLLDWFIVLLIMHYKVVWTLWKNVSHNTNLNRCKRNLLIWKTTLTCFIEQYYIMHHSCNWYDIVERILYMRH